MLGVALAPCVAVLLLQHGAYPIQAAQLRRTAKNTSLTNNQNVLSSENVRFSVGGNYDGEAHTSIQEDNEGNGKPEQVVSDSNAVTFVQRETAQDVTADCVTEHNKKRVGNLKVPLVPLSRDADAIAQAMKYARQLVASNCPFKHSYAKGFGENLYAISGAEAKCSDAVGAWYSEIKYFKGKYPGGNWTLNAGHFTQVMWASTLGVGCARTVGCPSQILICNYVPPGNYLKAAPFSEEVWNSIMSASAASPLTSQIPWMLITFSTLSVAFLIGAP